MKFRVQSSDLQRVWPTVVSAVGHGLSEAVRYVRCTAGEGGLVLAATNLEIGVRAVVPAVVEKPGETLLPPSTFSQIVRETQGLELTLALGEKELEVTAIGCRFLLPLLQIEADSKLYHLVQPTVGEPNVVMDRGEFCESLRVAAASSSKREASARWTTNGVLLERTAAGVKLVATDTKRLAAVSIAGAGASAESGSYLLPYKLSDLLGRLGGLVASESQLDSPSIRVHLGTASCHFDCGGIVIGCQLLEGRFPPYSQIIPSKAPVTRLDYGIGALVEFFRCVVAGADGEDFGAYFTFGRTHSSAVLKDDQGREYGSVEGPAAVEGTGSEITLRISQRYLLDVAQTIQRLGKSAVVTLQFWGAERPMLVRWEDHSLFLVMPMSDKEEGKS
jgi:DNA polymerase III subunit beta